MKKIIFPILIISPLLFVAQNIKREKVKSSYLSYPKIDMKDIDINALQADFCVGNAKFMTTSLKKGSNVCKAKGGKAQALEIFYYQVGVMEPVSYLKISDNQGNIKYIEKTSDLAPGTIDFGKNKCYWAEAVLKSAYDKEKGGFEAESQKELSKAALNKAKEFLNGALSFTYNPHSIEINYIKDKEHDYSDIERASLVAITGYEGIKDNADDKTAKDQLKQAVSIWEKAMTESTPDNKDARINKKVTLALAENLGTAYLYLMEFEKAEKVLKDALALEKNVTTNGTQERQALLALVSTNKKGYLLNKNLPINTSNISIMIKENSSSAIGTFEADYKKHGMADVMAERAAEKKEYNEAIESGEVNKYQRFVLDGAAGKQITLPDLASKMTKDPAGDKLNEFPEELTELTELNIIILRGNNIKSIPPSISKLVNLKKLVLVNNVIRSLPPEIAELKELKTLNLKGNPIQPAEQAKIQGYLPDCKITFD